MTWLPRRNHVGTGKSPRQFSSAFKEGIVLRLEAGETIAAVAEASSVRRKLLYEWRDAWRSMGSAGFNRKRGPKPGTGARGRGRAPCRPLRRPPRPALEHSAFGITHIQRS